mmetsp:Transcript_34360/g.75144  ORF Transcript_34360/g.75144 Transcript_34360/m.75144 type:complete len:228 (-) Transcript_34360:38-721(-)
MRDMLPISRFGTHQIAPVGTRPVRPAPACCDPLPACCGCFPVDWGCWAVSAANVGYGFVLVLVHTCLMSTDRQHREAGDWRLQLLDLDFAVPHHASSVADTRWLKQKWLLLAGVAYGIVVMCLGLYAFCCSLYSKHSFLRNWFLPWLAVQAVLHTAVAICKEVTLCDNLDVYPSLSQSCSALRFEHIQRLLGLIVGWFALALALHSGASVAMEHQDLWQPYPSRLEK